jgi:hypothetical protein
MKKLMKLAILLSLILAMCSMLIADTVEIGTGTATTNFLPIDGNYSYSYSQQIYTPAQINHSGSISRIRFYYVSGSFDSCKDWVIYMGHTSKTGFTSPIAWVPLADLTQVFAGDVSGMAPLANNWMEITLDTPFNYNNSSNLIIAVDENTDGWGSNRPEWGSFATATRTSMYFAHDTDNPNPASPPAYGLNRLQTNNRIQFVFPNSTAPLAPTLLSHVNGAWSLTDNMLSWMPTAGAGDATNYDVYFGTTANPPRVSIAQTARSYTPTLAPNTSYYWKVVAKNQIGSSPASSTWSFKTPSSAQLVESFEGSVFPPANWASSGDWFQDINYRKHGTSSARINGNPSAQKILSTPKLTINADSTLDFWTSAGGTAAYLQVLYSPDRVNWTQIGSNITYPAILTFYNQVIDLSSLAGHDYYLGFRRDMAASGAVFIDFVIGPQLTPEAPGPANLVSPAHNATGQSIYPSFTWSAPTSGQYPTSYKIYCDANNPPTTLIGTTSFLSYSCTSALPWNSSFYWMVVPSNVVGDAIGNTVRKFTTMADITVNVLPFLEGFETGNSNQSQVAKWQQNPGGFSSNSWIANSSLGTFSRNPRTGTFNAYLEGNSDSWLMRPFMLYADSYYDVTLFARQDTTVPTAASIGIYYGSTATTASMTNTIAPQTDLISGSYQRISGMFNPSTDGIYWIGIRGTLELPSHFLSLDDISVTLCESAFLSPSHSQIGFGLVRQGMQTGPHNLTLTNTGGGYAHIAAYETSIFGDNAAEFSFDASVLPISLANGQSFVLPVYVNATHEGPISATLRIIARPGNMQLDIPLSAMGRPAGIVEIGNNNRDFSLPILLAQDNSYSQSIYLQSEIDVPDQRIEKLYYYWNGPGTAVNSNDWTIYMGHTALTEFAGSDSWIALANLSQVFQGEVPIPAIAGWIEIPLTTPFVYNNTDNLVIAIDENEEGYDSSVGFFWCSDSDMRTIYDYPRWQNGYVNPDPAAPPDGMRKSAIPNLRLFFGSGAASAPELVISSTGVLNWTAVAGATLYQIYKSADPNGPFLPYATANGTNWTDPLFPQGKAFYKVKAVNSAGKSQNETLIDKPANIGFVE